jgi:hypothetical protein
MDSFCESHDVLKPGDLFIMLDALFDVIRSVLASLTAPPARPLRGGSAAIFPHLGLLRSRARQPIGALVSGLLRSSPFPGYVAGRPHRGFGVIKYGMALLFYRDGSRLSNVKILIALPDRKGGIWTEEFMSEDLCEEDIVGLVLGFEHVATDGAVG